VALWSDSRVLAEGSLIPVRASSPSSQQPDEWRVELEIAGSDLGRVRNQMHTEENLDVELISSSAPTSLFCGKLRMADLRVEEDNPNLAVAAVRIHPIDGDIPEQQAIPPQLLQPGARFRARISLRN
jgi:hypothetical protein